MRFNPVLERLTPYRAGPPLAEIRERYGLDRVAVLSANEVPWGPFPEVVEALKTALEGLNRYPDGACGELRGELAERFRVDEECLVFGNGSCELLMLLGQAFLGPGQHTVFPHPSFVMYRSIALMQGCPFSAVPLRDLDHDLEALLAALQPDTSLIVICNPNNPTGSYIAPAQMREFLQRVPGDVAVVLDEAYGEFVTSPLHEETASWVDDFPNLVILHTFSKIYGLAGLRLGYGIAHPDVVKALDKIRQPFNVDSLAQVAALESLRRPERVDERRRQVASERERVSAALAAMGVPSHPSQANFLLVDVTQLGVPGRQVPQVLLERGILTRSGYAMDCPGWIRVTMGDVEEGDLFLSAMADLRSPRGRVAPKSTVDGPRAETLSPES